MFKYILFIAMVSAVEKADSTDSKGIKPGDLDSHYEIDFEQDPDHLDENMDDSEIMDNLPPVDANGFMNMLRLMQKKTLEAFMAAEAAKEDA